MLRSDFTYNGHRLSDFNMKMFDTDADPEWIGRVVDRSSQTAARDIPMHFTTHYEDVLKHEFLIIRDPSLYASAYDLRLTDKDIDQLRAWLEFPRKPMELITTVDDEEMDVRYFGIFTSVQPYIVQKQCYGLHLSFTCNAPYGFSPAVIRRYEVGAKSGNTATVVSGDFMDYNDRFAEFVPAFVRIYPKSSNATFPSNEPTDAKLHIHNSATDEAMSIVLPAGYKHLEISSDKKTIVGTRTIDNVDQTLPLTLSAVGMTASPGFFGDLTQVFSARFLRIVPGSNYLTITNNTSVDVYVEVETRRIIKGGGF